MTAEGWPIHKGESRDDRGSYRLVSLVLVVPTVVERCILNAVGGHLIRNKLLSQNQHGKSCLTNLLSVLENVTQGRERRIQRATRRPLTRLITGCYCPSRDLYM